MIAVAMAASAGIVLVLSRECARILSATRLPLLARSAPTSTRRLPTIRSAPVVAAATAVMALATGAGLLATTLSAGAAVGVLAGRNRRHRARAQVAAVSAVPDACRTLAGHLRAGSLPADALAAAAVNSPPLLASALLSAAAAERLGASTSAALETGEFGGGALWPLAVCWQVCTETGAALGTALDGLAAALDAEEETRELVDAELAGVRLSATVMAGLPFVGLLLGTTLGADPVGFLVDSAVGRWCLATAVLLDVCGVGWVHLLGARAAR